MSLTDDASKHVEELAALFDGEQTVVIPLEDIRFISYMKELSDQGGRLSHEQLFRLELLHKKHCA